MNKLCEGCLTYDKETPEDCPIVSENREDECPCPMCLIKMMCESPCKEIGNLNASIYAKIKNTHIIMQGI